MARKLILAAALPAILIFVAASPGFAAEPVEYELRFEQPNTHLVDVTIRAGGLLGAAAEFAMPAWAPGSYEIDNYAQNVQDFNAATRDGRPLAWRKTDKQTWRIELAGSSAVALHYRVYANTMSNHWAQFNERHAFLSGPAVWMYLVGGKERPVRLTISVPTGWRVATGLARTGEGIFFAADYDVFADSPIEMSDWAEASFQLDGTTFHFAVHDVISHSDFSRFAGDMKKIAQVFIEMYAPAVGGDRPAPFADYWFLLHIWPGATGGLEHLNSTQTSFGSDWTNKQPAGRFGTAYELKLFVTAHELFHAWNVKRLRPKPLGPFDYSREAYTPSLWISEGLTSYYAELAMVRAGLTSPEDYRNSMSQLISEFEMSSGRAERSIEEASWDAWFYSKEGGENNLENTTYSYYDGGQIVGHLLDFAIRQATGNRKSLDDWMRLLYQRYALPKPGFEPEDAVRAASEVAGVDMSDFFRRYLSGKEPLPYETYFGYAGLRVERQFHPSLPWYGLTTHRNDDGHARITLVTPGSPADRAGLDRGDVIIAVDSKALSWEDYPREMDSRQPGQEVRLSVIRASELREFRVTPAPYPFAYFSVHPVENPTELQKKIFESWMGQPWDRR